MTIFLLKGPNIYFFVPEIVHTKKKNRNFFFFFRNEILVFSSNFNKISRWKLSGNFIYFCIFRANFLFSNKFGDNPTPTPKKHGFS